MAEAIKRGFEKAIPNVECLLLPVGDGGEGTVDAIKSSLGLEEKRVQVTGPFGDEVLMSYFQKRELALFEVANLVGLEKIPYEKRNPLEIQNKGNWSTYSPFDRTRNQRYLCWCRWYG